MIALVLGLVSVLILCLPWIGYASFVLSGVGLLLGLGGLFGAHDGPGAYALAEGGESRRFGQRARDYPLAGAGACLLALALALLPLLFR
jgi:hypothetical protein